MFAKNDAYPSPPPSGHADGYINFEEASSSAELVTPDEAAAYNELALRCMAAPMEHQGSGFFFHHYVAEDPSSPITFASYLPNLYSNESAYSALPAIISAIGMAGISNMQADSATMIWARQKHSDVLRTLNTSLQNPKTAKADSTMMTVMLLGLFELVTCAAPSSLKAWANHINGATAIAKVRGQNQLQTPIGRQIFTHLRTQVMIDCIQRRKEVPRELVEWSKTDAANATDIPSRRGIELFLLNVRLCHLRAVLEFELADDPEILAIAKSLDDEFVACTDAFPDFLKFKAMPATPSHNICSDYYHVYSTTWVVAAWNMWRCSRILLHEVMMKWLVRHEIYDLAQMRESEAVLRSLSADICASAPFVFGEGQTNRPLTYVPRAAAGTNLLWPLYVAATMDTTIPSTRAFCILQLDKLGRLMGIRQAASLAKVLKTQKEITAWDRFDHQRPDEELLDW